VNSRIISDSTCSKFKTREIEACIDTHQERITTNKFPNAESSEIRHYTKYYLENDCPDNLIVVAGLNDLLHWDGDRENANTRQIGESILNIGRDAKALGVYRVCISGLIKPKYGNCHKKVDEINDYLYEGCRREGFVFIDQSNIISEDLGDSIHVVHSSLYKLKYNVLNHLYTYVSPHPRRDRG